MMPRDRGIDHTQATEEEMRRLVDVLGVNKGEIF